MKNKRGWHLDIKSIDDQGYFEGRLSVYGVTDLGGDQVVYGAFTKSIAERGNEIPLLWQHDAKQPIGILTLEDTPEALNVKGWLVLEVEKAREALALMKAGAVKGMSIGYDTVKSVMEGTVRKLKEVRLWEGSLVTFPMLPVAMVDLASVKSSEEKADFQTTLMDMQTWSLRYQMISALDSSIDSVLFDSSLSTDEKTAQIAAAIDQCRESYLDFLPRWFALMEAYKSLDYLLEHKAGRRISAESRSKIEDAIQKLQALLEDSADEEVTEDKGAATQESQEPDFHSWLLDLKTQLKENVPQC